MFPTDERQHPVNAVERPAFAGAGAPRGTRAGSGLRAWLGRLLIIAGCTAVAGLMEPHFNPANITMIYLLGVVVAAIAFGRGPAVAAAVVSVVLFGYIFVPPRFTFEVADTEYFVTFGVMLVGVVVIGVHTPRL